MKTSPTEPSPAALRAAKAIEADHQFGRMEPQRIIERALLIDAEFRAEREEMVAALKTIKREARSRGEYNPLSGETRMSEGYQRIIELADSALQRAEQAGAKTP